MSTGKYMELAKTIVARSEAQRRKSRFRDGTDTLTTGIYAMAKMLHDKDIEISRLKAIAKSSLDADITDTPLIHKPRQMDDTYIMIAKIETMVKKMTNWFAKNTGDQLFREETIRVLSDASHYLRNNVVIHKIYEYNPINEPKTPDPLPTSVDCNYIDQCRGKNITTYFTYVNSHGVRKFVCPGCKYYHADQKNLTMVGPELAEQSLPPPPPPPPPPPMDSQPTQPMLGDCINSNNHNMEDCMKNGRLFYRNVRSKAKNVYACDACAAWYIKKSPGSGFT
jgi:hypothetical protein